MELFVKNEDKEQFFDILKLCKVGEMCLKFNIDFKISSLAEHDTTIKKQITKELRDIIEKPENSIYYDTSLYIPTEVLREKLAELEKEIK